MKTDSKRILQNDLHVHWESPGRWRAECKGCSNMGPPKSTCDEAHAWARDAGWIEVSLGYVDCDSRGYLCTLCVIALGAASLEHPFCLACVRCGSLSPAGSDATEALRAAVRARWLGRVYGPPGALVPTVICRVCLDDNGSY